MAKFEYSKFLDLLLEFKFHEFDWDEGNMQKSKTKHNVLFSEAEEVFFDDNILVLGKQIIPKHPESRFGIIGRTLTGRILFVCFTIRDTKVRIISARSANKNEKAKYEN